MPEPITTPQTAMMRASLRLVLAVSNQDGDAAARIIADTGAELPNLAIALAGLVCQLVNRAGMPVREFAEQALAATARAERRHD